MTAEPPSTRLVGRIAGVWRADIADRFTVGVVTGTGGGAGDSVRVRLAGESGDGQWYPKDTGYSPLNDDTVYLVNFRGASERRSAWIVLGAYHN